MKTYTPKQKDLDKKWYLIDAKDKVVGKLATIIANKLRGKDKPIYTPNMDCGDFVIVINTEKIKLTGNKSIDKKYYTHSGYPGGLKEKKASEILSKTPTKILEKAVNGMLPKNKLRNDLMKKLKLYSGEEHPHKAQTPETLNV